MLGLTSRFGAFNRVIISSLRTLVYIVVFYWFCFDHEHVPLKSKHVHETDVAFVWLLAFNIAYYMKCVQNTVIRAFGFSIKLINN